MGCSLDSLAFKTAQEALQHYNGKKHRFKMERHLKNVAQESFAIHIKGKVVLPSCLALFVKQPEVLGSGPAFLTGISPTVNIGSLAI